MQATITLGDTLNYPTTVLGYAADDGWVLKTRLVPRVAGPAAFTLTAVPDSTDPSTHRTQVTASETAGWTAGTYSWFAYVEKGTEQYKVAHGQVILTPDPRVVATLDSRSAARIALDNVRAVISGNASAGILSYTIAGRSLERYSMADLLKLESSLKAEVQREENCAAMAAGLPSRRKTYVRLNLA